MITVTVKVVTPAPRVGQAVQFLATAKSTKGNKNYRYSWRFGDGGQLLNSTQAGPTHVYANAGDYTVTCTVTTANASKSDSGTGTVTVRITAAVPAPVANAGPDLSVDSGQAATFRGSVTGGTPPLNYSWDFGDGTAPVTGTLTPSHTYAGITPSPSPTGNSRTYTATLTVTDAERRSSTDTCTVTVTAVAPPPPPLNVEGGSLVRGVIGQAVDFRATLTGGVPPFFFSWNFGDGSPAVTGTLTPSHVYQTQGSYTATISVTGAGQADSDTVDVVIAPLLQATLTGDDEGSTGQTLSFNTAASNGVPPYTYAYDFGDGATRAASSDPTATHAYSVRGTYIVTVTVRDAIQELVTRVLEVEVAPTAVVANAGADQSGLTGVALSFSGSASGGTTPYSYFWNFGDGQTATGAAVAHAYANPGDYVATLTVTDSTGGGGGPVPGNQSDTDTAAIHVALSLPPQSGDVIDTGHDRIPDFGANPDIVSAQNGNWNAGSTWVGGVVPAAGQVVAIAHTVTYNQSATTAFKTVAIRPGGSLRFRTDMSTKLHVTHCLVYAGGELTMGTLAQPVGAAYTCELVINNVPLDTAADPEQYGNGLIVLGKFHACGLVLPKPWLKVASAPAANASTITLAETPTNWRIGDTVHIPDSHMLEWNERIPPNAMQWEVRTITGVSGATITLDSPLSFAHPGNDIFLPHVGNITRNVKIKSESSSGVRGHTFFTDRADIDIRAVQFAGLGRTTNEVLDSTTFDDQGNVTHIGANQIGRYPVHLHHLKGPVNAGSNPQYTFVGNSVVCLMNTFVFKWGIAVHDSHYGLLQWNVVYNWAGAGIAFEDGSESFNMVADNFVARIKGTGSRDNTGRDGVGIWFHGPNNYCLRNVCANVLPGFYSYGFTITPLYLGVVQVPVAPGSATTQSVDMNGTAILAFEDNEVYGCASGMTVWWIGTFGYEGQRPAVGTSTIKNLKLWNYWFWGLFLYETFRLTVDGLVVRGSSTMDPGNLATDGIHGEDYEYKELLLKNLDIRYVQTGVSLTSNANGLVVIRDSFIQANWGIVVPTHRSVSGGAYLLPKSTLIKNVSFSRLAGWLRQSPADILLFYSATGKDNVVQADYVYVEDYNGVVGDNFQVFIREQAPDFIVPQTGFVDDQGHPLIGSPVAGETNAQNWANRGLAIHGAVMPATATDSKPYVMQYDGVGVPNAVCFVQPTDYYTLITADMLVYRGAWKLDYTGIPGEHRFGRGLSGYTVSGTNYLLSATSAVASGEYGVYEHPLGTPTIPGGDPYDTANYPTTQATKIYDTAPFTDSQDRVLIGDNDSSGDNGLGWDSVNNKLIVTYSEGYGSSLGCAAYGTLDRAGSTGLGLGRFTLANPAGFKAYSTGALVVPSDYADRYLSGNRIALFGSRGQSVVAQQDLSMGFSLISIGNYQAASGTGQKWTDLASTGPGSTWITSVTGGFTSDMVGKRLLGAYQGTNFIGGGVFTITHVFDGNNIGVSPSMTPAGAGSGGGAWLSAVIPSVPLVGFWPTTPAPTLTSGRMNRPDGTSLVHQAVDGWPMNKNTWTDLVEGADWIDFTLEDIRYQGVIFVGRSSLEYVGYCNADVVKGGHKYMVGIYDPARLAPASGQQPYAIQPDELTYLTLPSINQALYAPGPAKTITQITSNNTKSHNATDGATVTCAGHGLSTGNIVGIAGAGSGEYNQAWEVYVVNSNTVTLRNASVPGNWSGVTVTNGGMTLRRLAGDAPAILGCKFFADTRMWYILHQIYSGSPGPDQLQLMVSAFELVPN